MAIYRGVGGASSTTSSANAEAVIQASEDAVAAAASAATSETNAAASAAAAANTYDDFDDRYLGAKASSPATDNDGDPLVAGALYFNTADQSMYVYDGSAWNTVLATNTSVESIALTSGQTSVVFSGSVAYAAFYITGPDVDNGRLLESVDYTVDVPTKTVTLTQSYPAGTTLTSLKNVSEAGDITSANSVSYNQGGTGAVTRTVEARLSETVSVKDFGAVGDGVTDDTAAIQAALDTDNSYIPTGTYITTEQNILANNVSVEGIGVIKNTTIDQSVLYFGEKQSGADAKYSYAKAYNLNLIDTPTDTDDNWAALGSSSDFTTFNNVTVQDSYVGLSFNKNYNYTTVADSAVSYGSITGNVLDSRFMGVEHFGTKAVATAGNSVKGTGKAGPAFRYTGDADTPSLANGLNVGTDASNGLSIQTYTWSNNLVGNAFYNCTNGFTIPENTTLAGGSSANNIVEFTARDVARGGITYNTQYNWIRGSIENATTAGFIEYDTTGVAGIGDLKNNKIDLLITNSATGALLEGSFNEVTINASDITFSCLTVNGDHNNIKLICDNANTVLSTQRALNLNGTHNLVEVISTNNSTIGSSGDILIAGDKNHVRVMTDATVRISGNNNVVYGFAASTVDVGTGNDVTGVSTY